MIEHSAAWTPCPHCGGRRIQTTFVPVDTQGEADEIIDLETPGIFFMITCVVCDAPEAPNAQ